MKIKALVSIWFGCLPVWLAGTPDISMEICRFNGLTGPYVEISLYVVGSTLQCDSSLHQGHGLDYIILIKDAQGQVYAGNKYRMSRPGCPASDMIDTRRFMLGPGTYDVALEAFDLNDSLNRISISQQTLIEPDAPGGALSDIQLLSVLKKEDDPASPLNKSGLYMEPLAFRFYYSSLTQLNMYVEAYHADALTGQPYMQYTIKPAQGDVPPPVVSYKKVKKEPVTANVFQLDISNLISGQYVAESNLYDGNKQLIASRKTLFTRSNPKGDSLFMETAATSLEFGFVQNIPEDSLDYTLKAMAPILHSMDVDILNVLLQKGNTKAKRFFIHRYWTNEAGKMAGPAFYGYMKVARVVDYSYRSGFGYGFETDRGHIFLKYGKPDDIIEVEDEPSAPPYEIWFYNSFPATHQSNVRFLFYNPSLAKNAFTLLHSTAIGEIKNERWEVELYRDATLETPGVNDRVMGDNVYRNARKYFEQF